MVAEIQSVIGNPVYIDSSSRVGPYFTPSDDDMADNAPTATLEESEEYSSQASSPTMPTLTERACERLSTALSSDDPIYSSPFTVQLLSLDKTARLEGPGAPSPWRVVFSDGVHYRQALLSNEAAACLRLDDGAIQEGMVVIITSSKFRIARGWSRYDLHHSRLRSTRY